jgi:Xaa-Pro aminopeptidase
LQISISEQQFRLEQARSVGRAAGVDYLLLTAPENLCYFSGFRTTLYTRFSGVVIPVAEGEPALIVPSLELRLALDPWWSPSWLTADRVVPYGPRDTYTGHLQALGALIPKGSALGVDALNYATFREIEGALKITRTVSLYDEVNTLKQIKSDSEIATLAQANQLAIRGMERAQAFLQAAAADGRQVTELDIALELELFARREGAESFGYPTLVSFGEKMLAPHSPPLRRAIPPGEVVRVAFGPVVDGYTGDVIRTFVLGAPPPHVLPLQEAFLEAQEACFAALKPGVAVQTLVAIVTDLYERRGVLSNWSRNIGHGLGMTIHEPPRILNGSEDVLREGMVLAIEPSLGAPGGGYAHCDVVRVTATGCEVLSPGLRGLVVITN